MLTDTSLIGNHDWFLDGACLILAAQKPDGSWAERGLATMRPTGYTYFAMLFFKRAARPLVGLPGIEPLSFDACDSEKPVTPVSGIEGDLLGCVGRIIF